MRAIFASCLLRYRLRWYAVATARLLLRRWQGVALGIGLLASANTTVFDNIGILSHPLLASLDRGHGAAWRFAYLLVVQAVAVLWAVLQRAQIEGGGFMAYAGSLPFSDRQRRTVDLAVLLLADSPPLLMLAGALGVTAAHRHATVPLLFLCDVALLALVAQLAALERRAAAWAGVTLCCAVLAAAFGTGFALPVNALAGLAAGASAAPGGRTPRGGAAGLARHPAARTARRSARQGHGRRRRDRRRPRADEGVRL